MIYPRKMVIQKSIFRFFAFLLLLVPVSFSAEGAETAMQAINRTVSIISRTNGIKVKFSMSSGGHKASGDLKAAGTRFAISSPGYSTWYDGKTMWVHNSKANETTISVPTRSEVAETNPLALISANSKSFNAVFVKNPPKGCKVIKLTPKVKGTGVKRLLVTIGATNYKPSKIVVTPTGGQTTVFEIKSLDTSSGCRPSDFVYPKSKYKSAEMIDLR